MLGRRISPTPFLEVPGKNHGCYQEPQAFEHLKEPSQYNKTLFTWLVFTALARVFDLFDHL